MIHGLSLTHLGVIEAAELPLSPGFTAVTGETGAGKTMVLTGIGMVIGAPTAKHTVRSGAEAALAEATIDVPHSGPAADALADAGAVREHDGAVVVSRSVGMSIRSRLVVGGRTVPQPLWAEIAQELVTVHGQSDQVRLRTPARQRATLDAYAGADHAVALATYAQSWRTWQEARRERERLEEGAGASRAEVARLRDDVAAYDEVAPEDGESSELLTLIRVLENSEAVRSAVSAAYGALAGEDEGSAAAVLDTARKQAQEAAQHDDALVEIASRIAGLAYEAADVAAALASYLDGFDADPRALDRAHSRRSELAQLERRLGVAQTDWPEFRAASQQRIDEDDNWDQLLDTRRREESDAYAEVQHLAEALSARRRAAAQELAADVNRELAALAMQDATFAVAVDRADLGPSGHDQISMTLAAHPGAPTLPVAEAASGGELSRIMLAIEVSLAKGHAESRHTFVFDEVDAGVGGRAAVAVGKRLADLATTHQVVVVTHLAQVAAQADAHIVVAKSTSGEVTRADVRAVTGHERVDEIARLLSGSEESQTARAHALELLGGNTVTP